MGFSLNNLTLFGLVLAIGIVVDDAIVVVEAVEHHIEHGLSPRDATLRAMEQVSGPVIAVGLVLTAVFVPCAFITGITGQFFRQFALTIAVSTVISAFNSLTLSPALTALLLRPRDKGAVRHRCPPWPSVAAGAWLGWEFLAPWVTRLVDPASLGLSAEASLGWARGRRGCRRGWPVGRSTACWAWFFALFNRGFDYCDQRLRPDASGDCAASQLDRAAGLRRLAGADLLRLRPDAQGLHSVAGQGLSAGQLAIARFGFARAHASGPCGRSNEIAQATDGVKHTVAIAGQSILLDANAPNFGAMYVMLDDFHHRLAPDLTGDAIAARLQARSAAAVTDGTGQRLRRPAGGRAGHRRRFQDHDRRPRRHGARSACKTWPTRSWPSGAARARAEGPVLQFPRQHPLAVPGYRPFSRRTDGRFDGRSVQHAASVTSVRCTSTTSTASAAPGRSTCRPTQDFRQQIERP